MREMVFFGDGWVGVERGKSGKGGKVGTYLAYLTLKIIFFFVGRWMVGS